MSYKLKVYLDTSVISYLDQADAPERSGITHEFWELLRKGEYDVYISNVVLEEINMCDDAKKNTLVGYLNDIQYHLIEVDSETIELANKIIDESILKQKSFDDSRHIAAAIKSGCDVIASWNFKHIVNVKTIRGIRILTMKEGYKDIMIYSPTSLLDEENE